jgi:hypothetical protein
MIESLPVSRSEYIPAQVRYMELGYTLLVSTIGVFINLGVESLSMLKLSEQTP